MNLVFKSQIPLLFIFSLMLINCEPQPTAPIEKPDNRIFIDTDPAWSPDGKWIAYTHSRRDTIGRDGIYIIDTAGTTLEPYIKGGREPDWSPDMDFMAFGYGRQIYIAKGDSTQEMQQITTGGNSFSPSVSPDGNWISFNISVNDPGIDTSGVNIVDKSGKRRRWIVGGGRQDWSSNGFTFTGGVSVQPGKGHREIFICDNDGNSIKRLTYNGYDSGMKGYSGLLDNIWPSWSPDGSYIAWQHDWEVWIMNADGSNQKKLTDGEKPDWSPDSKKIVFSRYVDDHNALFIMDRDGTNIRKITGHETYS